MAMKSVDRILAVAAKEWQLNMRFPVQYFAGNLMSPVKSAVLMYLIYQGFLRNPGNSIGELSQGNFQVFVFLGTMCHSLFSNSVYVFSDKLTNEKWWQTVTATLVSPASSIEMILGFLVGSGGVHIGISVLFLTLITIFFPVSLFTFSLAIGIILMLAVLGFGVGLIGATVRLCFEGKAFLFDYGMQVIIFLSCFYYPIEIIPTRFRWIAESLPSFQMSRLLHHLYLNGYNPAMAYSFGVMAATCGASLLLSALYLDYSIRRFGIVGY